MVYYFYFFLRYYFLVPLFVLARTDFEHSIPSREIMRANRRVFFLFCFFFFISSPPTRNRHARRKSRVIFSTFFFRPSEPRKNPIFPHFYVIICKRRFRKTHSSSKPRNMLSSQSISIGLTVSFDRGIIFDR